jgi:hypothetical protein
MSLPFLSRLLIVSLAVAVLAGLTVARDPDRLTSRPLPALAAEKTQPVGTRVSTKAGQRLRVLLPNRTVAYLQERSTLTVKAADRVELSAGEAFFETATGKLAPALVVATPKREVRARDSRFGVRIGDDGTSVLVAAGQARVKGMDEPVRAGQQLEAQAEKATAAPRISHLVAWTRDLRQAAPLVPASEHAGGSLIARDPDGQEARLELRRYHIDVHVEDGFARTTIEQTYFNHTQERLEGTFRIPLPPDASLSRLAMYVDGNLMEGGMAERDYARGVYERIVWEKRDPALLEWVDGTTFKMRVFPLEPRQEKRLLLSYTQRLESLYGEQSYRFPAGHSLSQVGLWSLRVRVKGGANGNWLSDSHELTARKDGQDLLLEATRKDARLDRDVVLRLREAESKEEARFAQAELDGQTYFLLRYRPTLAGVAVPRRDWVILVETSADRDPLLARTQVELVRALLGAAGRDDTFTLVTAATRTRKLSTKPMLNEPAAAEEAIAELEKAHLVGAFDLGKALSDVRPLLEASKSPWLLHIGSGIAAMGERRTPELLARLPKGTRYVGVGVGKRWDRAFMRAAAERTGGYFTQVNPDELVAWRGLDLLMTLNTPRLLDVRVSDPDSEVRFLPFVGLLTQGEELAAVARLKGDLPKKVRIKGSLAGREFVRDLEVANVRQKADYLPRSWAKLEIDRLLSEDAGKHKQAIIELSKAMYVMTPFTSLLVLESDDMYRQFKVDRGRKDHWAMYPAPQKIKVVYEPIEGDPGDPKKGIKPSARVVSQSVLARLVPQVLNRGMWEDRNNIVWRDLRIQELTARAPARAMNTSLESELLAMVQPIPGRASALQLSSSPYFNLLRGNDPLAMSLNYYRLVRPQFQGRAQELALRVAAASRLDLRRNNLGSYPPALGIIRTLHDPDLTNTDLGMEDSLHRPLPPGGVAGIPFTVLRHVPRPPGVGGGTGAAPLDWNVTFNPYTGKPIRGEESGEPEGSPGSLLYTRPGYSNDDRVFYDLVSYAPGLNTTSADLRAVIEAEARTNPAARRGTIAAGVRALFAKARNAGWRTLSIPAAGSPAYTITFDGTGRHAWERTLQSGLRERVVCDDKALWHLYPDLGLAARRTVSRAHRLDFWQALPWVLPLPEDLARGADLKLSGDNTVAIVPHAVKGKQSPWQVHLVFKDGRVVETRWVNSARKKTLRRKTYAADGTVKVFDKDDKEVLSRKWALEDAEAPLLKADVKKLVVLDLPFRSPAHVREQRKLEKKNYNDLTFAEATVLLTAFVANGEPDHARQVFQQALSNREQRQLGYYVLLASAGVNLDSDNIDVLDAHPHEPLAHYLALHSSPVLRKHASRWAAASNPFGEGMLRRLALGHALCQRWSSGKSLGTSVAQRKAERQRALAYVKQHKGTALAWALLGLAQARTAEEKGETAQAAYGELADAYELFVKTSGLSGHARYEQARCLWKAGKKTEARKCFLELYQEAVKRGELLAIDADFRAALVGGKEDGWSALLRRTAADLVKRKDRYAALTLARQTWQLDDAPLAQHLFAEALKDAPIKGKEGLPLQYAALIFLHETSQTAEADRLVRKLLAEPDNAKRPDLWRTAARLAEQREMPARRLACLEKALELEFASLPEVLNLEQVRSDYGALLEQYESLAKALATLKQPAPVGFRDKVVRAADRWRALDRDQERAANMAAHVLRRLGERELAWDYLTTPVALRPGESDVWAVMARTLQRQGERDLADRAYQAAFERESSNAQLLWDRADNLRQAGRLTQAQALYRQIANGDWQPRFASLKTQAKGVIEGE